jgi:hypothetical protein
MLHMHIRAFQTRYNLRYMPFMPRQSMVLTVDTQSFELPRPYSESLDGLLESCAGRAFEVVLHVEEDSEKHGFRLRYQGHKTKLGDIHGHWSVSKDFYEDITKHIQMIGINYVTCELRAFHEQHIEKSESPLDLLIDYEIDDISFPSRYNRDRYTRTKELDLKSTGLVSKTLIQRYE